MDGGQKEEMEMSSDDGTKHLGWNEDVIYCQKWKLGCEEGVVWKSGDTNGDVWSASLLRVIGWEAQAISNGIDVLTEYVRDG